MPEASASLLRTAGYAAISIIPVLIGAGVAFWLFLNGAGAFFGPVNDLLVVVSLALLALPVLGIRSIASQDTGPWFDLVSVLALAGIALAAIGQLLLVFRVIPLEASFVTGGLGIVPVLAWAVAIALVAGRIEALPAQLSWATIAVLVMIVITAVGSSVLPGPGVAVVSGALLVALTAWLVTVGWTCLGAVDRLPLPATG